MPTSQEDVEQDALEGVEKIHTWLQPTDYLAESSEFRRHLATQAPGTGLWLRQTDEYRRWRDSEHCGSMWVKGVPGAGKSVVAASMIDLLRTPQRFPVLFFFFRQIVAANHTPRSLVKDWLAQLLPHSSAVQESLSLCLKEDVVDNCSDDQLWHILLEGLSSIDMVYCVADALDEMDSGNEAFLSRLNNLAAFRPQSVKLLLTSRPKQYLQSALKNAHIVHVSLEKDLVKCDISAFVWYRLSSPGAARLSERQKLRLKATICSRSQGLFLYARLITDQVLENLVDSQSIDIEALAQGLPVGLEEMYNDMLFKQRISMKIDVSIQRFLLQCVTHSARPLRLNELASALGYAFDKTQLPPDRKGLARTACGPLLQILEDETVQVIHHSFTEFLCDRKRQYAESGETFPTMNGREEHKILLMLCLKFLRSGCFDQTPQKKDPSEDLSNDQGSENSKNDGNTSGAQTFPFDYQRACLENPLLEYAVNNWTYHASHHNIRDHTVFQELNSFLVSEHKDFQTWLWLQWGPSSKWEENIGRRRAPALHIAAFGGLIEYARDLLDTDLDVNERDTDRRTALHWASRNGHADMATLLLERGADANPDDIRGLKPIHIAAKSNFSSLMRVLLEAGVEVSTPKTQENHACRLKGGERSTKGETPLEYACQKGNTETVCEMLGYMTPENLDEALCIAISRDRIETVHAIFERAKPSPNAKFEGRTAVYRAATQLQESILRELLARGADVSLLSGHGGIPFRRKIYGRYRNEEPQWTPIHGMLGRLEPHRPDQFRRILQLLLDAGVDCEAKNLEGQTALIQSVSLASSRPEGVYRTQILLECGANVSPTGGYESQTLNLSLAQRANLHLLEILLASGAKPEASKEGQSALKAAVSMQRYSRISDEESEEYKKCIELLLQHGAVCDLEVLISAFGNVGCSMEVLRLLLASSQLSASEKGLLFHHIGHREGDVPAMIKLLKEQGADIETLNSRGSTAFLSQIGHPSNWDTAMTLLEHGASWDVVDQAGQNALWSCHRKYSPSSGNEPWERLLELGLSPVQPRSDGRTLLHSAALHFDGSPNSIETVERLLDLGLDINHKDNNGSPPIHLRPNNCGDFRSPTLISIMRRSNQILDINAQDSKGMTALHLAAACSEIVVSQLLDAGVDARILSKDGRSALHVACEKRTPNIVGLLIQHANDMANLPDHCGMTPLHLACASGRPETVYYLLKAKTSVDQKDGQGNVPLHSCAFFSERMVWEAMDQENPDAPEAVKRIIKPPQFDPDIERKREDIYNFCETRIRDSSDDQETARVTGITRMLLAYGANSRNTNKDGNTPLDLSILWGRQDMADVLLDTRPPMDLAPGARAKMASLTQMIADLRHPSLKMLDQDLTDNSLFLEPCKYGKVLTVPDLRLMIGKWQEYPDIEKGPYSLIPVVASFGLTELMEVLGNACKLFDAAHWIERSQAAAARFDEQRKADVNKAASEALGRENIDIDGETKEEDEKPCKRLNIQNHQPALHMACERETSNMLMVELLVDRYGVDVNARCLAEYKTHADRELRLGDTALHRLAIGRYWWHIDAIRYLVAQGANVNAKDENGETPLHIASGGKCTDNLNRRFNEGFWSAQCVSLLLDLGADPNAVDNDGFTCLNKANKEPGILLELLKRGAIVNMATRLPLFSAINYGVHEAITALLDHGADVNAPDLTLVSHVPYDARDQLRTPLFCAAIACDINKPNLDSAQTTALLLKRGADWKVRLHQRETLVHYVFENAKFQATQAFLAFPSIDYNIRDQSSRTVLHAACEWNKCLPGYGHLHWYPKQPLPAIAMLDLGADINATDDSGRNALHFLLDNKHIATDIALTFLQRPEGRPLIPRKDKAGRSPLHTALHHSRIPACDFLLAHGASLLDKDARGRTALHYLSDGLSHDNVASTSTSIYPTKETPPMTLAADHFSFPTDSLGLWQRYVAEGGDIDAKDDQGNPPLFTYLASEGKQKYGRRTDAACHVDAFAVLFGDADVFARNGAGETALHVVARRNGNGVGGELEDEHDAKLFQLLVGKGLDPLVEDGGGRSALDIAVACGNERILEMFRRRGGGS